MTGYSFGYNQGNVVRYSSSSFSSYQMNQVYQCAMCSAAEVYRTGKSWSDILMPVQVREHVPYAARSRETYQTSAARTHPHEEYRTHITYGSIFTPEQFIVPGTTHPFVGEDAQGLEGYVREACSALEIPLPEDVRIHIVCKEALEKISPGDGVLGVSINRKEQGKESDIFVLQGALDRVLITLGHELGHVLTPTLAKRCDEEAKAFAFTEMWVETLREHNIAGLAHSLRPIEPAKNGLHDLASSFVQRCKQMGRTAREVYRELILGSLQVSLESVVG